MAKIQTMGLFGLGGPEIVVILLAIGFVLGPQKIAELAKDLGKSAGDLKDIPIEFQKGFQEGQEEASKGQIAALSRGAGVKANDYKEELKEVPKEFKKGMEEAEDNMRAKKAKPMDMSD
jgi:sec-independent protein translocase protein TatA